MCFMLLLLVGDCAGPNLADPGFCDHLPGFYVFYTFPFYIFIGGTCVVGFVHGSCSSEASRGCSGVNKLVSYRGSRGDRTFRHKYGHWNIN